MRKKLYIELLGWYGVIAILLAYVLSSFFNLPITSILYLFLNFSGAVGLALISIVKRNHQPMVSNAIWAVIALVGLVRAFISI